MIFPKKPQILYAPMLSTFGGGSARGFGKNLGILDAQGIADKLVSNDTSVLTDDNMALLTIDETAMETVLANSTASTNFYNYMLVQKYVATGNSFGGSGTSTALQNLNYTHTLSPGLALYYGYKAYRQGTGAPDAAVYVFKNFHPQGDKFSYYHEGFNSWDMSNTPHFAGFTNSTLSSQFQNRAAIYNYGSVAPLAYSRSGHTGGYWNGYAHLPSGLGGTTNANNNQGYIFALTAPNPASYQYFFVGVSSDDGSTAGRTHRSKVAPLYAAKNGFT
jgi:hypothetical protein